MIMEIRKCEKNDFVDNIYLRQQRLVGGGQQILEKILKSKSHSRRSSKSQRGS